MSPDKVKTIGFGLLGVWALLAAGLGYLAYDATSVREEIGRASCRERV